MPDIPTNPLLNEAANMLHAFLEDWHHSHKDEAITFGAAEQFAIRLAFEWMLAEQRRLKYALDVPR